MLSYLVVASIFALAGILLPVRRPNLLIWGLSFLMLVVFVGLRHKVGMDWNNYLAMSRYVEGGSLWESFEYAEPGYAALIWASTRSGAGVYGANLVGATIFCAGLFRFARTTPLPWVALTVAMPVLVIVTGMSANRQSIAIGVLLWLVGGWETSRLHKRVLLTLLAAMFHFSAVFFLAFAALDLKLRAELRYAIAVVLGLVAFFFLQASGGASRYDELYISGQSAVTYSSGATQHVLLNGIPALLFFLKSELRERLFPSALYRQMAWVAMALVPAAFFFSVASGRMTLYLFPVSMFVFAALPGAFPRSTMRALVRTCIAVTMLAILSIWLNFANSRFAHLPYKNALFIDRSALHL